MAKLAELRRKAKALGMAPSLIRSASSPSELTAAIKEFQSGGNGDKPKAAKKSAVKKAVAKKGSTKKISKSASSKSVPAAKSARAGKAKRPTTAKATKGTDGPAGRNLLDSVDFTETDGWNAREDSAPDRIVKALRKFKGNRSKVFDALEDDVWDFVGKKKRDGSKRTKADALAMLRYRIARTAWDFAVRTGQHDKSQNRAEYGTAGTGAGTWKPAKKSNSKPAKASAKKASAKKASTKASKSATGKKRGRPAKVKTEAVATKATGKKRGRPKGSKNKAKAGKK